MNKKISELILLLLVLSCSFIFAEEEKFMLPDLFITARDTSKLDLGDKISLPVKETWQYKKLWKASAPLQIEDKDLLDKLQLVEASQNAFFTEARVKFGLPSFLGFGINHGYKWQNMPYFLSLEHNTGDKTYANATKEDGYFFGAVRIDPDNVVNLKIYENKVGGANLNSFQVGWSTFWNIPITYKGQIFNSNSYAGNSGVTYLQNELYLDIGQISIMQTGFPAKVSARLLNSSNNSYGDLRLGLFKEFEFFGKPNLFDFGLNAWGTTQLSKIGFYVKDAVQFTLTKNTLVKLAFDMSAEPLDMDNVFKFDFAEINDSIMEPDQKVALSAEVNNYFGYREDIGLKISDYANINIWDDKDNDGFYSYDKAGHVQIYELTAKIPDVKVYQEEKIDLAFALPIYNSDIPNRFTKLVEATYKCDLYGGKFKIIASFYSRELGKTVPSAIYKEGYLDLKIDYEQLITTDLWWGAEAGNLLSSGAEKLSGHKVGDPYFYLKLRIVF